MLASPNADLLIDIHETKTWSRVHSCFLTAPLFAQIYSLYFHSSGTIDIVNVFKAFGIRNLKAFDEKLNNSKWEKIRHKLCFICSVTVTKPSQKFVKQTFMKNASANIASRVDRGNEKLLLHFCPWWSQSFKVKVFQCSINWSCSCIRPRKWKHIAWDYRRRQSAWIVFSSWKPDEAYILWICRLTGIILSIWLLCSDM